MNLFESVMVGVDGRDLLVTIAALAAVAMLIAIARKDDTPDPLPAEVLRVLNSMSEFSLHDRRLITAAVYRYLEKSPDGGQSLEQIYWGLRRGHGHHRPPLTSSETDRALVAIAHLTRASYLHHGMYSAIDKASWYLGAEAGRILALAVAKRFEQENREIKP